MIQRMAFINLSYLAITKLKDTQLTLLLIILNFWLKILCYSALYLL